MSDQPQSPSVWPESSGNAGMSTYPAAPVLEPWLQPVPAGASEERSESWAISERPAPATLHDAAHALMNI